VDDVISPAAQDLAHLAAQPDADGEASLRPVGVDGLTATEPDHVRLRLSAREVRRDDVDVVAPAARLTREEVDVLADATQMRVVVLGHERDAQTALVVDLGENRKIRQRRAALERGTGERRIHERHGRLVDRATRDTGARNVIEPTRMKRISRSWAPFRARRRWGLRTHAAACRAATVISLSSQGWSRQRTTAVTVPRVASHRPDDARAHDGTT
jgi:hypothetical protein